MRRFLLFALALALVLPLMAPVPAHAARRHTYTHLYYTVKHHISKAKAGENIRRRGDAKARDYRREIRRLRRVIEAAKPPWSYARASWYGPGFYGRTTACGQTLWQGTHGVAHRTLACGTRVELRYGGRRKTVRVIDRGPYVAGRTFDLAGATASYFGFGGVQTVGYRILR